MKRPVLIAISLLTLAACSSSVDDAATTLAITTTAAPVVATTSADIHTGRHQEADCTGERPNLDDADGDGWGACTLPIPTTTQPPATVPHTTIERTTTTTLPAFSVEEIAAVIVPPAAAWLAVPSGPGFDAVALAANQLLDSGRVVNPDVWNQLNALSVYPGSNGAAAAALNALAVGHGVQGLPAITAGGSHTVGVDIAPGRYRTLDPVDGCYWETLDSAGEINDNNFVNAAPQVIMTVRSSDYAVNMERCGLWVMI